MTMERTIQVLNRMRDEGTFESYAIGGGIGVLRFLEEAEVSSELLDRILTKHGLKTAFENMRRSWHGD